MDGPEILGGLRPLGRECVSMREAGIHLEGMLHKKHMQETEATWDLGELNIIGMKELSSSKALEETVEVCTAAVWGMACIGGSHGRCRED